MVINYLNKKIEKVLSNQALIRREYGKLGDIIPVILSVLEVADNLGEVPDVPPMRRHKLTGQYQGCWGISINKNWRMIIKPNCGERVLKEIKEITIIGIVDYH